VVWDHQAAGSIPVTRTKFADSSAYESRKVGILCGFSLQFFGGIIMPEYIREVEKTIDNYHQHNRLFALNRSTALFNALTVFEDACRLGGSTTLTLTNDQLEHSFLIREQLDALNVLVQWIFEDCPYADGDLLDTIINPKTYMLTADALQHHAKPYSPISSAYISYSRGQFKANIDESILLILR